MMWPNMSNTKLISLKLPLDMLEKMDNKAWCLKLNRTSYLRSLIANDLKKPK
jgi:hypothetical protein